ncbi:RNA polymerase sigma factor [Hymenobacter aquaticus]|uniref:RNA polymerase sigma factor SigS n=1 Tax=Hymenobacter aquaticus TaxID=1867101 RepID=A0A4Z0Q417_9BACT|nr:RNA polymerase sigma factor [Hymenobacter aquaticus]TGE24770.1 RNA polymerase sigma factor [Hymenobacter aquaticus]
MSTATDTREEQASACLKEAVALRPELLKYARKLTFGDDDAAKELVQEATLRLHESVQRNGRSAAPVKLLLFRIMRNSHVDAGRVRGRANNIYVRTRNGDELTEHAGLLHMSHQEVQHSEDAELVTLLAERANLELTARFSLTERIAFRLTAENFSTREVGEMMGRPHSTVHFYIKQIRKHLQLFLRPLLK